MNVRWASLTTIRSGVITRRIEAWRRSRRISFIAISWRTSFWTSAITSSPGISHVHHSRDRLRRGEQPPLPRKDLLEPPVGDVREAEQAQRFAGRRAVDDDGVVVAGVVMALDLQEAEELIHPRRNAELLGRDVHHAAVGQHRAEPRLDAAPVGLHLALGLDLLAPQHRRNRGGVWARARLRASPRGYARGRSRR